MMRALAICPDAEPKVASPLTAPNRSFLLGRGVASFCAVEQSSIHRNFTR